MTIFSPRSHLAHDAFRPDGLGDLGWYVLAALRQPTPIAWMPVITGIPPDDMEDLLAVMARAEIVDVEDGLVTITPETVPALDAFAVRAGTAGEGEGMRELHRGEREAFRSRLRRALNVPEATP